MAEPATPSGAQVRSILTMVAQVLRRIHHLGPEAQLLLADLVEELGNAVDRADVPPDELARLTEDALHLVEAVHDEQEPGVMEAARDRVEKAAVAVETGAPNLAELTRRLAETLSNLGI